MPEYIKQLSKHTRELLSGILNISTSRSRINQLLRLPLYSNTLSLLVVNGLAAFFGFVFWVIAARLYSEEIVGIASATIAAMGLLASFANLGLGHGLIRFIPHEILNANSLLNSSFTINILASLVIGGVFIIGLGFWSPELLFLQSDPLLYSAFIIFTVAFTLKVTGEESLIAYRRSDLLVIREIILNIIRLALVVILASVFQLFGIFVSWGIALWIAIIVNIVIFIPMAKPGYRPHLYISKEVKKIAGYSFGNYIGTILAIAPTMVLPIMAINILNAESTAYLYIAWSIASILSSIAYCISMPLFAEGSFNVRELSNNLRGSLKLALFLLVPTVVLLSIFADKILLVFGEAYSENATYLIRLLSFASFPMMVNVLYISVKKVEKRIKTLISVNVCISAGTLGLSALLMPEMGIIGAGVAWLVSHAVVAVFVTFKLISLVKSGAEAAYET